MSEGFDGLYKAKLRDNNAEYSEDDYKRFCRQLNRSYPKGILDLSNQRIGINMLTKLTKILRQAPYIRVFNFYGNLIRDHGMHSLYQLLSANSQVEVVDIGCNDLGTASIMTIIDIIKQTGVKSLQLGATDIAWHNNKFSLLSLADLINAIRSAAKIECLGLNGIKMSVREAQKRVSIADTLADYINEDETLRSISICDCGFTLREEDVVTTQGLLSNNRLKFLDFHSNQLADPVGPNFLRQLNLMTSLAYLDIHSCNLSEKAGCALAETLKTPSNLTILNISDNYLGDEGINAIFSVLLTNQTLTEINAASNKITEESAVIIGHLISENKVLCYLNLSKNPLGDNTAFRIADSISENEALTKLDISSCRLTDVGATVIAKSLADNTVLKYLDLSNNFLTRESGYQIIDAIRPNETLFKLDVSATQIDHFVSKAIKDLGKRNKQIQKEIDLQPLKQQMVQLSIQRTKMPEAISRIEDLNNEREKLEREVYETQEELDMTESSSNANIIAIRKIIQSTKEMIVEQQEGMKKITVEHEKMIQDYEKSLEELRGTCEKERIVGEQLEIKADELEQQVSQEKEALMKEIEEKKNQIQELLDARKKIMEVMDDPEQLREFEPPKLSISLEPEKDAFFLNDEIMEKVDAEKKKKKKGAKKGKKKAAATKTTKSPKRKKSPKSEAPAPAQEENAMHNSPTESPASTSRNEAENIPETQNPKAEGATKTPKKKKGTKKLTTNSSKNQPSSARRKGNAK